MDSELHEKLHELNNAIKGRDSSEILKSLYEVKEASLTDERLYKELTAPPVIQELYDGLINGLGIPAKILRLRKRIPNRKGRAQLFLQVMINGVNYYNEHLV